MKIVSCKKKFNHPWKHSCKKGFIYPRERMRKKKKTRYNKKVNLPVKFDREKYNLESLIFFKPNL